MATPIDNYKELTLDNGLVIALQNTPTQTISARLRVFHGGLHENQGEDGLAHFLEHAIMTSGGRKYSPDEAARIMANFGDINASTSSSQTHFPAGMLAGDLEQYLDLISDIAFHPRFDLEKVNQERQRVLRETADTKSNPSFKDNRDFMEALYGLNSPHTYFTLGKEDVVMNATPDDLKAFHERGYNPNNMTLVLVGALPENAGELVAKYFGDKPRGEGKKYDFPVNPRLEGKTIIQRHAPELYNPQNPGSSSAHFGIGFAAAPEGAEDNYAVNILNQILGGDANARLFRRISREMGLAYGIGSRYLDSDNSGAITVSGSVHAAHADEAMEAAFNEMGRLRNELVGKDELERIKQKAIYRLAKGFETNEGHVFALQVKLDSGLTPELFLQKMDAVTPEMVREAANKYFPLSREEGKYVLMVRSPLKGD